jgi:hypothetical protein
VPEGHHHLHQSSCTLALDYLCPVQRHCLRPAADGTR